MASTRRWYRQGVIPRDAGERHACQIVCFDRFGTPGRFLYTLRARLSDKRAREYNFISNAKNALQRPHCLSGFGHKINMLSIRIIYEPVYLI